MLERIKLFVKFACSSVSATVIDLMIFQLMLFLLEDNTGNTSNIIIYSTIAARVVSSIYNYIINRNLVFKKLNNPVQTTYRFAIMCITRMSLSAFFVAWICLNTVIPEIVIKMIVDAALFVLSYNVQKAWVFADTDKSELEVFGDLTKVK